MKSIVEEALSRAREEQRFSEPTEIDKELEDILIELRTEIAVVGCGGGGSNTVTRMSEEGINGARLIALNTDAQHLIRTEAETRILIGKQRTRGLGAGSIPQVGEEAALENEDEIKRAVEGCDMVFITTGLGAVPAPAPHRWSRSRPGKRGPDHRRGHPPVHGRGCHPGAERRGRSRTAP